MPISPLCSIASEPIAVVVGTGSHAKRWYLPKELLGNASPFFAAALNGSFAEAAFRLVDLPEDNADAFALFIRWLYVGEISVQRFRFEDQDSETKLSAAESSTRNVTDAFANDTEVYLRACILGDKLGCPIFQDLAMLKLIERHMAEVMSVGTMRVVFEQSAPGSKLRRFAIDQFRVDIQGGCYCGDGATFGSVAKDIQDIGLDFLEACMETGHGEVMNPTADLQRYLEVLTFTKE